MTDRPAFLFVHGAWHAAWQWDLVRTVLDAQGWRTVAIDLPSAGSTDGTATTMADDASAVAAAIDDLGADVVVVGHSYGGVPVTQAAFSPRVRRLVYVAAFALDVGESPGALLADSDPDLWTIEDGIVMVGSARRTPTELLYADVEPALAAASAARLTPQSAAVYSEALTRAAWREKPSTFVVTRWDAVLPASAQEMLAARAGSDVRHLDTGHSPFLSQPEALAALLVEAAES